ncbi:sialate O-acetylesterase [Candidatus Latescibacterota bacterium]
MFIILLCWTFPSMGDVSLPSVFSENMVIQRDRKIPVWGWANPDETLTVSISGQKASVKANNNGEWMVNLKPLQAGGPFDLTIRGNNTIVLSNVLIGDVWLCSGQSNMELPVHYCNDSINEIANAMHPKLRLFQIDNTLSPEPLEDCKGIWEVCRPSTIGKFSATAYYFGREVIKELDVPVGLIHASWGGTTAEVWMSSDALKSDPDFHSIVDRWEPVLREKSQELVNYYIKMGQYHEDVYHIEYAGKPLGNIQRPPESPVKMAWLPHIPSWVHNAMIAPLVPYAIKGVIWYQGESNSGRAYQYRKLLPALINDWRRLFGQGDFPFLIVQLANIREPDKEPQENTWAELREAQLMALDVPRTALAVTIDIGDAHHVHPKNKQDVGKRLALGALKVAYNRDIVHSGPIYDSKTVRDGMIHLRFTNIGSGLVTTVGESLKGFAIAGEDKKFVWAKALIEGDEVIVRSDDVPNPVAVRYGWAMNPVCNLYNREGLPASPFRTDDWPGITVNNK